MIRLALFASGTGSNAVNITNYFADNKEVEVALLVCNKPQAPVIKKLEALGVEALVMTNQELSQGDVLLNALHQRKIDFVVLAGYLRKIPDSVIAAYPQKMVNVHPSLLPKYGGKGMYGSKVHEQVIANGESKSGITIHFVNEHYDEGGILFQAEVAVAPDDTPTTLASKIHQLEHKHFPEVICQLVDHQ